MSSKAPTHPEIEPGAEARRRRSTLLLTLVAALTILVPFLFWKQTWFGQPLTAAQITEYLADTEKPRRQQQALVQIEERIERGDSTAGRWYPQMVALKDSPTAELRVTLAWVLGSDNRSDLFHETLLEMLQDDKLLVRRNAALSLIRFGDVSGREVILQMLRPYTVHASASGVLRYRLDEGASLASGDMVARIERTDGTVVEVRASLPGKLLRRIAPESASVTKGEDIAALSPGEDHVWEALRALLLIGRAEDVPLVEAFARADDQDYSSRIREQALLTLAEIRKRSSEVQ